RFKEYNLERLMVSNRFVFFECDIRDKVLVAEIFNNERPDVVIHLAAKAGVRPSIENVSDYYDVNINGTLNLLENMRKSGVSKLVFASSSSVYGNNEKVPFSEDDVVDYPISPYAATKKSGELLCHVYSSLYGFDISCLRFFTVYGPRQRPDLAIHKFTRLIDQGRPLPFYGDGNTARDYTYISDIINGISGALGSLSGYNIYNIGEARVIKLKELISTIEAVVGKPAILDYQPLQAGDVQKTYADITKAKKEIGYKPAIDFEPGIRSFVEWYKEYNSILYN
ncbi:MAG TPA: GDP-mannose 4,6-dehydratase, partial [Sphingobacteriaceae bacterium]